MNVEWDPNLTVTKNLYFKDINVGEAFRISTTAAKGAVYLKTRVNHHSGDYMMEIATGKLFSPTGSLIEVVPIKVVVGTARPSVY